MTLLSLSQGWLAGCCLASLWCGVRARRQGYSTPLFFSLGLLLGLGAVPVTWVATQEDLKLPGQEIGLNPLVVGTPLRASARFDQGRRQLSIGLVLGAGGGLLANASQALTHLLPQFFMETAEEYERGLHPGAEIELKIRILWVLMMLVGPTLIYFCLGKGLGMRGNTNKDCHRYRGVIDWPAWVIPAALLMFFVVVGVAAAMGLKAYWYLGISC